nr:putative ribonuclease H-like domain-containing protein [Tanacetum cinerariifolium]
MEQPNPTFAKIPILDTGKYKQWKFRIQQYLQNEHYALWEVIEFDDSYEAPQEESGTGFASESYTKKKGRTVAVTTEDMQKRRNDVKARTTLLLALYDEHQLRFNKYKTASELWAAILKTFGGNEATKKTKKNQLKQQYGNFKAEGSETLEQTFNRLHAIVSHLEFMDVEIEQDDPNQKFLTSLAPEWLMYMIVWRNRGNLDTISLDDLYNHLKVYEPEVQKKSESNSQNMAFISSAKNNNGKGEVNTTSIPTASTYVSPASADVAAASISHDTVCAYIASQFNDSGKKITIQGTDVAGFEKSKVECFNCHKIDHFARECREPRSQDRGRREIYKQGSKEEKQAPKALMAINGVGWDWSYMANKEENHALVADEKAPIEFALMAKSSSSSKNEVFDNSLCSKSWSQRSDKNKEGLGYSAVPPLAQVYSPPKKDMSWTDYQNLLMIPDFKLKDDTNVLLRTPRQHNMYSINLNNIVPHKDLTCLVAKASADESMLWHRRLGHLNFKTMNKLARHNLVKGLPSKCFENDHTSVACLKRKHHKASCKNKLVNLVSKPLYTLHMDLFGPTSVSSLNHKWYCLVVTDDFSRFTWTFFLKTKDETSGILRNFITEIENLKELKVKIIKCDNRGEFRNKEINDFYSRKGIKREFNNARTPQQNRVAKRRNRTLIETARTMLADAKLPVTFWAEAVNTACYVQNRVLVNKSQNKTLYELFNSRTPAIGFLKPFGCHVMILNTLDNLGKFDAKGDRGYFIGYSMSSKAFRVFNKRTKKVEENLHYKGCCKSRCEERCVFFKIHCSSKLVSYAHLESSTSNAQDACNADAPKSSGNPNPTATSINPPANQIETLTVESAVPTVSSPVLTACLDDSPEPSSTTRLISKRVISQDETPSLDNISTLSNRFKDTLGVTTNTGDTNGVEANLDNMEYNISASPTPTFRIHKDHLKSQIIGPMDTPIQTRNKSKEMEEQNFIATIHQKTTPDLLQFCLFSCFLSQEEPKKISDALKDPSWVEAMQEELLQFKIQNVWILVDCPEGVRPIGTKWVLKNKKDEKGDSDQKQSQASGSRSYSGRKN